MADGDNYDNDAALLDSTEYAVVFHAVAPKTLELAAKGFAEGHWICSATDAFSRNPKILSAAEGPIFSSCLTASGLSSKSQRMTSLLAAHGLGSAFEVTSPSGGGGAVVDFVFDGIVDGAHEGGEAFEFGVAGDGALGAFEGDTLYVGGGAQATFAGGDSDAAFLGGGEPN